MPVDAILDGLRTELSLDRWTREPHLPRNGHARGVETRGHPGHRQGPVEVVLYVLLTAPQHFHRRFDLLGHERRIRDEVLRGSATPETAADKRRSTILFKGISSACEANFMERSASCV